MIKSPLRYPGGKSRAVKLISNLGVEEQISGWGRLLLLLRTFEESVVIYLSPSIQKLEPFSFKKKDFLNLLSY